MRDLDANYECDLNSMGYDYENWQNHWYSPVCRGWYRLQADNPDHSTVTDLYTFADGTDGLTACAPILDHLAPTSVQEFFGTLCVDIAPRG